MVAGFVMSFLLSCSRDGYRMRQASIYDAWDARYVYDVKARRMIPYYGKVQVGRAWGRDEYGRMNYATFLRSGESADSREDLLIHHKRELDRRREILWEVENKKRLERIRSELESNMTDTKSEVESEEVPSDLDSDEMLDFLPSPFLPVGIDESSMDVGDGRDAPFMPFGDAEGKNENSEEKINESNPFAPLNPF